MKRREPQSLQQVLAAALGRVARRTGSAHGLLPYWREAVGAGLCRHSTPVWLDGTRLQVDVTSAAWGAVLASQQREILQRLAQQLGPGLVTALKFQVQAPT